MKLFLDEDQELIAKTAQDFVAERSPVSRVRELRDSNDERGYSPSMWKEMGELGWLGIPFAERYGGADLGMAEMAVVLEALGKTLAPEPVISSVLLGGGAIALAGSEAQKAEWLPRIAEGTAVVALAHQEPRSRYSLTRVETTAERTGDGWRLSGHKTHVLDGHLADAIVVPGRIAGAADSSEGISLFLVPAGAPGLASERESRVDGRNAASLTLDGVEVSAAAALGSEGEAAATLEAVVDRATAGLCAEMIGGMQEAFDQTIEHLKQREQFGTVIGTFQALKHRAAYLFIEIELARSAALAAARAIDEGLPDMAKQVSHAKARCSEAYLHVGHEAVQMFGGVGMTDEYDIGFYLKRARAAELTFGDAAHHRDRWARATDY